MASPRLTFQSMSVAKWKRWQSTATILTQYLKWDLCMDLTPTWRNPLMSTTIRKGWEIVPACQCHLHIKQELSKCREKRFFLRLAPSREWQGSQLNVSRAWLCNKTRANEEVNERASPRASRKNGWNTKTSSLPSGTLAYLTGSFSLSDEDICVFF